jgi:hypothetical protein
MCSWFLKLWLQALQMPLPGTFCCSYYSDASFSRGIHRNLSMFTLHTSILSVTIPLEHLITHTQVRTASHFEPSLRLYASINQLKVLGWRQRPVTADLDWESGIFEFRVGVEFMGQVPANSSLACSCHTFNKSRA